MTSKGVVPALIARSSRCEGANAEVRLERPREPAWNHSIWLDQISRVEHLDSIPGSVS